MSAYCCLYEYSFFFPLPNLTYFIICCIQHSLKCLIRSPVLALCFCILCSSWCLCSSTILRNSQVVQIFSLHLSYLLLSQVNKLHKTSVFSVHGILFFLFFTILTIMILPLLMRISLGFFFLHDRIYVKPCFYCFRFFHLFMVQVTQV